ncbi:hypothetical protein ACRRTK_021781 [Alexandromys fortis]
MSRSWGRAHLHWLGRELPARPLPGAALSRVTAAVVVAGAPAGGTARVTLRPIEREAARSAHRPTPRPAGTAPAPPSGEQAEPRPQPSAPRTPESPPPSPLPPRRIEDALQVGYVTAQALAPLSPVPPRLNAWVPGRPGQWESSTKGFRGKAGEAGEI